MSRLPTTPPLRLFEHTSDWFERARAALLGEIPCRQGCHRCCIGLFPVTVLDQHMIQQGLRSFSAGQREAMIQAARRQTAMISGSVPRLAAEPFLDEWPDQDIDAVVEHYRDLPCPALQADGSCGIYAFRPLTCRSMGIPGEVGGTVQGACDVQTSVPLIRLSRSFREEEDRLARMEAEEMARLRSPGKREELFLPYAFLSDPETT